MLKSRLHFGNSLIEYALPLAILVCFSSFIATSGSMPDALKNYFQTRNNAVVNHNNIKVAALGTHLPSSTNGSSHSASSTLLQASSSPVPGISTQPVCLKSNFCVNVPVIASGSLTDTTGGLGGNLITGLANVFDQLNNQLQAQGADPGMVSLITKLALQGHSMGDQLSYLQTNCSQGNTTCDFGKIRGSVPNISATNLKQTNTSSPYGYVTNTTTQYSINPQNFQQALQAVNTYLSYYPGQYQDISDIINTESEQILNIVDGLDLVHNEVGGQISSAAYTEQYSVPVSQNNAKLIHQDSNTICSSGGKTNICLQKVNTAATSPSPGA